MNKKYILIIAAIILIAGISSSALATERPNRPERPNSNRNNPNPVRGIDNRRPDAMGIITEINGNVLNIESIGFIKNINKESNKIEPITYKVNIEKAEIYKNGEASKIENLSIGDKIVVEGEIKGDTITATKIHEGNMSANSNSAINRNNITKEKANAGFWKRLGNFFGKMFNKE
jgi:hypothetical protein